MWVPDEGSEALRDLVRAREAAKQDQLRARHRLGKFLLRSGQRPAPGVKAWTQTHLTWVRQIRFSQMAQESTRLDYLHEVEHMAERVVPQCFSISFQRAGGLAEPQDSAVRTLASLWMAG